MAIDLLGSANLGFIAGVLPVYLGLVSIWVFKHIPAAWRSSLVAFSVGILLFLFVDVTHEGLKYAEGSALRVPLFAIGLFLGLMGPSLLTRRRNGNNSQIPNQQGGIPNLVVAYMVAAGIGLHNLGEGLAIGAAYAAGEVALTGLLVTGFALHNGTEGLGIAGPLAGERIGLRDPIAMGFLAGFPTVVGSVIGTYAFSEIMATLFFATASGAVLFVIIELARIAYGKRELRGLFGVFAGILVMYLTSLLISI